MPPVEEDHIPTIFISHNFDDKTIAAKLARELSNLSEKLEFVVAGNSEHRTLQIGSNIAVELANWLHKSEVVLLLYSSEDKDWTYCLWEAGVATDPQNQSGTKKIVFSLTGTAPSVFAGDLFVKVNDRESVRDFVKQLCLEDQFFHNLNGPLTDRKESWLVEAADRLFEEMQPFVDPKPRCEFSRLSEIRIKLEADIIEDLLCSESGERPPKGADLLPFLDQAVVIKGDAWAMRQFEYEADVDDVTLANLHTRWFDHRQKREETLANVRPWTEIVFDEIWRICERRPPNRTWEAFLALDEGAWISPIVTRWFLNTNKSMEFDIAFLRTHKPGAIAPGE